MSQASPTFTVIVPAYNTADYIPTAVNSVLDQTFGDWELIVVDDASSQDDADEVMRTTDDPRVRIFALPENRGISGARNEALRLARGRYVVPLDSDDWVLPTYLEEVAEEFSRHPELDVVSPDARMHLHPEGVELSSSSFPSGLNRHIAPERQLEVLLRYNYLIPMSAVRTDALRSVGGWRSQWSGIEDRDLWIRLAASRHPIGIIPRPLAVYRVRRDSVSHRDSGHHAQDPRRVELLSAVLREVALTEAERRAGQRSLSLARARSETLFASTAIDEKRYRSARHHAMKALRARPDIRALAILLLVSISPRGARAIQRRRPRDIAPR